jgi:hypothetical protein
LAGERAGREELAAAGSDGGGGREHERGRREKERRRENRSRQRVKMDDQHESDQGRPRMQILRRSRGQRERVSKMKRGGRQTCVGAGKQASKGHRIEPSLENDRSK